jgi:2-(1,2-epoxy-1,2-dihydrophenyl)acetyl-CoA isomerase
MAASIVPQQAPATECGSAQEAVEDRDGAERERGSGEINMETLKVERAEGIVQVTLNRPERKNAINGPMWDELLETFGAIGRDAADRVVVITGAGGEFCSGADLSGDANADRAHPLSHMRHVGEVCAALHALPQPVIAKVVGVAVGAGMNLALGCDLVVASDTARFSEIFARRGLSIDFGGSWVLPRLIGLHKAKELALFADIISAEEALALGIVNRVVPVAEIDEFVDQWAARLANGPPIALAQTKQLLNKGLTVSLQQALDEEGRAQTVNFGTADTTEAMAAFLEKRDPVFRGR